MNRHIERFLSTESAIAPVIARVTLGLVFLPHGLQKTFGWFGGDGFSATLQGFTEGMGIPFLLALLVILTESVGALFLIAGCLTRLSALGIVGLMTGAILTVHLPHGFFMNWSGTQQGEGFEYHLLAIALALTLVITGGGKWSLDDKLVRGK